MILTNCHHSLFYFVTPRKLDHKDCRGSAWKEMVEKAETDKAFVKTSANWLADDTRSN